MKRKLIAALACRNNGSRMYGKPLQILYGQNTILDQIIASLRQFEAIDEIVLGIAEGADNHTFIEVAKRHGIKFIIGDMHDVLGRLIECGECSNATDIFRVTTECPWFYHEIFDEVWRNHLVNKNDITVTDRLPEGMHFEIFKYSALATSHLNGSDQDRSEYCSNYARMHQDEFKIEIILPPLDMQRMDLRVTVDNPEDLILCRAIASANSNLMPLVPSKNIVNFIDMNPNLHKLVLPFVSPVPVWDIV